jgi:hypothetical protein
MFLLFQKVLPAVLEASLSRVYLTVRYQLHTINVLAMCSSPNGYTFLATCLICNVFGLYWEGVELKRQSRNRLTLS